MPFDKQLKKLTDLTNKQTASRGGKAGIQDDAKQLKTVFTGKGDLKTKAKAASRIIKH